MGVTSKHAEYEANESRWTKCRDVAAGSDPVKRAGSDYLPILSGQNHTDYEAYKSRALFYNATARTIEGLAGSVFRKPPSVTAPDEISEFIANVTSTGVPLETFAKQTLKELLEVGRIGILVDMPGETSAAPRAYLCSYKAEQIVNWRTERIEGRQVLTMVVLHETREVIDAKDQFAVEEEDQYRVLSLEDGRYVARIWRKLGTDEKSWMIAEEIIPKNKGKALNEIPFVFVNPTTLEPGIERPPILDLVEVNLSHYRSSADLEHGRHFTALPTPWVAGFDSETELRIGSSVAWVTSNVDAHAGMLEFTGQGLGALEKAIDEKEAKMAALGARLLEEQKRSAEAADTVRMRHSGEAGVLQSIAQTLSLALTKAFTWAADWMGAKPDVSISLNTDFFDVQPDPAMLAALVALWQGGGISKQTLYFNLQRGELTRPGSTFDEEEALISAGALEVNPAQ